MAPPGGGKELEGPLALGSLGGWPGLGSLEDIPDGGRVLTKIVPGEASREGTCYFIALVRERSLGGGTSSPSMPQKPWSTLDISLPLFHFALI